MSTEPASKRVKASKVIGTHSGPFHADEALAVFLLRLTEQYRDADVVRTRDAAKLEPLDIVVDVGGTYSPATHRYDHHQRGFEEVFGKGMDKDHATKLSSAGLVYKHFGKEVIQSVLNLEANDPKIDALWLKIYKEFIEAIDAIDNGISLYPKSLTAGQAPAYSSRTDLSARVGHLNPRWNEEYDDSTLDARFEIASKLAGTEFLDRLNYYATAWLPARDLVWEAMQKRHEVDESGLIVMFDRSLPWKEHLHSLEPTLPQPAKPILYILYPEGSGAKTNWRIQAVPESPESFESRKALPESWRGVRDEKLSELIGIPGAIFCHASGFIGGNQTKEGALEMARRSIKGE